MPDERPPDNTVITPGRLSTDRPIESAADDVLDRAAPATRFAKDILALDSTHGLVVGVLGAWGSGKTSYVNLAREALQDAGAYVVDFNPWMFSGADRLIEAFFSEISATLKVRPALNSIGTDLEEYG